MVHQLSSSIQNPKVQIRVRQYVNIIVRIICDDNRDWVAAQVEQREAKPSAMGRADMIATPTFNFTKSKSALELVGTGLVDLIVEMAPPLIKKMTLAVIWYTCKMLAIIREDDLGEVCLSVSAYAQQHLKSLEDEPPEDEAVAGPATPVKPKSIPRGAF